MEAITVFTETAEQGRALKAFLKALKMSYTPTPVSQLAELEAKLTPAQKAWWLELKANIIAINRGDDTEGRDAYEDLEDFLKDIENADKTPSLVSA